ncbi:hypothetical protein [Sphingobacterium chuzhouense]|uniref:Uncharacterized protein n=1 Tax=Sphingobacterium chuzhouense TaxID=1742264 RepID=A0ABR7XU48_9SPHI|nr:hypothetical protein [Sphingobacterium chuzhouense]MBD1422554.1 hypothetical protein [Sphingobacterium chuzhouense]
MANVIICGQYFLDVDVILEVDGSASRVVNTFTASTVHMMQLDTETGMLQYIKRVSGE